MNFINKKSMAAKKPTTIPVNLRRPVFLSLLEREYTESWTEIGMDDFSESEQEMFTTLFKFLPQIELNERSLMLAKADSGGSLDQIFKLCICRDGDQIILNIGANAFPMTQEGSSLVCGQLKGMLETETADEKKGTFRTTCSLRSPAVEGVIHAYDLLVLIEKEVDGQSVTRDDIKGMIADGSPILDYLEQKSVRAEKMVTLVMNESGEIVSLPREFAVKAVVYNPATPESQYGDGFTIQLDNGLAVYASGNSEKLVRKKHELEDSLPGRDGNPWKLVITEVVPNGEKFQVKHRLCRGVAAEVPMETAG